MTKAARKKLRRRRSASLSKPAYGKSYWSKSMQCRPTKWTRNCALLSLSLLTAPQQCTPEQVDSFCALYTKVIVNKGDAAIQAPLAVKKRLLVNEKLYNQLVASGQCSQPKV